MKITFIVTVFNEEDSIEKLLNSLSSQSTLPDEIIIVDGGSSDRTVAKIKDQRSKIKRYVGNFIVLTKKGNRAVGRNEAVRNASGDIIVCSDAGCFLDKDWIRNITKPFINSKVDVVAGYYKGEYKNIFQKSLIPYVFVMPDKVDSDTFLPATRSMAFRKNIWKSIGGFAEQFSHNEDYVFANDLKKVHAKIVFEKTAIAYWIPRENLSQVFSMLFRFALGDMEAGIIRPKVVLVLVRYWVGFIALLTYLIFDLNFILYSLCFILLMYIIWAIVKNYKYIKDYRAFFILPVLQIVADVAVISGSIMGLLKLWGTKKTQ